MYHIQIVPLEKSLERVKEFKYEIHFLSKYSILMLKLYAIDNHKIL